MSLKRAVFILGSNHNNISAISLQMRNYMCHKLFHISFGFTKVISLTASQPYSVIFEKPRRKSAQIPFTAYVRAGAHNNIQSLFICRFYKAFHIKHTVKAILALTGFMQIPAAVGFHRIKAYRFKLGKPISPLLGKNSEIMHSTAHYLSFLTINKNFVFFCLNQNKSS